MNLSTKASVITTRSQDPEKGVLSIEQAQTQAIAYHRSGHLQDAERLYRAILQVQPQDAIANHSLGVLAVQVKQPGAGLPHLRAALEVNPNQGQYWISYIDALIQAGQFKDARRILEKARETGLQGGAVASLAARLDGPLLEEMTHLVSLFNQGRYAESESLARTMTEQFPNHGFGWKVMGSILQKTGRLEDAVKVKERAVQLIPDDAEAHNNLAHAFQELGRLSEAESSLRKALALNPKYAQAYNNLGMTLQKMGNLDEAQACLSQALALKPDYAEACKNLGNIFLSRKMMKEAVACYEHAIAIAPDYAAGHNNLGTVHCVTGNFELAILCYQKANALEPLGTGGLYNLGNALYQQGDIVAAMDCFKKALTLKPDKWVVDSAAYLAVLCYLTDDRLGALRAIQATKREMVNSDPKLGAYIGYLESLISTQEKSSATINPSADEVLYVIGESHALSPHNVQVVYKGQLKTCRSAWILGCKQWHLGNNQKNMYKRKFKAEMERIPPKSTILLTIGEIDCRPNEGILHAWKKSPGNSLDELTQATVTGYVRYVAVIAAQYEHQIIIGGVPSTHIPLNTLTDETARQLVGLIQIFNAMLKEQALALGMDFLDVCEFTDQGDGTASGQWHIDDFHLTPAAMVEAFKIKENGALISRRNE